MTRAASRYSLPPPFPFDKLDNEPLIGQQEYADQNFYAGKYRVRYLRIGHAAGHSLLLEIGK
jgi:hypothetical protein